MRAAELFVRCLENEAAPFVFGVPGEENLDVMDALLDSNLQFVQTRHEQGAAFMADVQGRLTGRASVCLATLGPGATNLVTGVADAQLDHVEYPEWQYENRNALRSDFTRAEKSLTGRAEGLRVFYDAELWSARWPAMGDTLEVRVRRLLSAGLHSEALQALGSSGGGVLTIRELESLAGEIGYAGHQGGAVAAESDAVNALLELAVERPELAALRSDAEDVGDLVE